MPPPLIPKDIVYKYINFLERNKKSNLATDKKTDIISNDNLELTPKSKTSKIVEDEEPISPLVINGKDFKALINDDITEKLTNSAIYCREKERIYILDYLTKNNTNSKTLFICGQPGTGKTSLIMDLFNNDESLKDTKYAFKIYLNCMSVNSIDSFFTEVFNYFRSKENLNIIDKHITNVKTLHKIRSALDLTPNNKNLRDFLDLIKEKFHPIILLDEVDYFYQKNKDIIFYELLNIPYLSDCDIKLMMISNNSEFDKDILPKIENQKIKVLKYVFTPYTVIEIYEILKQKLIEMKLYKNFQDEAIKLIAKKLANKLGDLRPAIEVVKKLILNNKEEFKNNKIITLRDVMSMLNQKYSSFCELMNNLTVEQKIVIASIYFVTAKMDVTEIDEKQVLLFFNTILRY